MDVSRLAQRFEGIALSHVEDGSLVAAPLPDVATSCLHRLEAVGTSESDLATLVGRDPMLTLAVLKAVSKQPAPEESAAPRTVLEAVTRLGAEGTVSVLRELCGSPLPQSIDREINHHCKMLVLHSMAVATLAKELGDQMESQDGAAAHLVGLVHDAGKLALASLLLHTEKMMAGARWLEASAWLEVVQTHRKIGLALAKKWCLPPEVSATIAGSDDYDAGNRTGAANVVRFANALAKVHGVASGPVNLGDAETLVMIGGSLVGVDAERVDELTKNLRKRIEQQLE